MLNVASQGLGHFGDLGNQRCHRELGVLVIKGEREPIRANHKHGLVVLGHGRIGAKGRNDWIMIDIRVLIVIFFIVVLTIKIVVAEIIEGDTGGRGLELRGFGRAE